MLKIKNYVLAQSLEEAWELNQKKRNRILGGMLWSRMENTAVDTAIDLQALGLDKIEETETGFKLGAMVTLRQLETHPGLNGCCQNAVRDALKDIVGVQMRNMATLGGSLWARFGFSDVLTVFLSMDCTVELYKGGMVPLARFAESAKDRDILVALHVKKIPGEFAYDALRIQKTDLPVLNCAVSRINGEYRAVIGARPGRAVAVTAPDKEELLQKVQEVKTGSNTRGSARYRARLARVLTERNLEKLGGAG